MRSIEFDQSYAAVEADLASQGLVLCDLKAVNEIETSVWLSEPEHSATLQSGSLLLLGHAGKQFWEVYQQQTSLEYRNQADPVDRFSAEVTEVILTEHFPQVEKQRLFPSADCSVNLMALGDEMRWHSPSPLGMGIHSEYGLWSAYRAVWWLNIQRPTIPRPEVTDICVNCQTQACVSACPGEAITFGNRPNLNRCADYRLEERSACASTCLARRACPYATEHQYPESQMAYHYELARSAIQSYRSQSE